MLATVAALQLLVLSQVPPPPKEVTPADGESLAQNTPAPPAAAPESPPQSAPLPRKAQRSAASPAASRQLSLLSAEPLGGGSAALAWAGWSSLGIMYGQGITPHDDIAGFAEFEWARAELKLGGFYRRPLGQAGIFDMAGRLSAAWLADFGATWIRSDNHADRGIEVSPGLSFSTRGAGGVFSAIGEAPLTVTWHYSGGFLFTPRVSVAYEGPLYPELNVGARLGLGYRAGSGDAPDKEGHAELMFLVLATYQLL